jgi:glycosyltransferase involved in cell wall biosynthesis
MVSEMPEVSVIIIGRNEAACIEKCLHSVFAALKGVDDHEVIYVDSASEDDTVKVAGQFPIRILQLRREWRLSPAAGRYIGYQYASGQFLAFVDGDTVVHPTWLAESCAFLRDNPEYGGVAGVLDKADLSAEGEGAVHAANYYGQTAEEPLRNVITLGGIATYRRKAMQQAGTFNPYLPTGEECEVALRIRRAGYKLARLFTPMGTAHTLPPESVREIMRRSRAHLYDYGATLRYCLTNGFGFRFSIEQMQFFYTFVGGLLAVAIAVIVSLLTGTAVWLIGAAVAVVALYLIVKRRGPTRLGIGLLKRTMVTYCTILSFLNTKPVPVESYPRDVLVLK